MKANKTVVLLGKAKFEHERYMAFSYAEISHTHEWEKLDEFRHPLLVKLKSVLNAKAKHIEKREYEFAIKCRDEEKKLNKEIQQKYPSLKFKLSKVEDGTHYLLFLN